MPVAEYVYAILAIEDSEADAYLIREAFRECGHGCVLTFVPSLEAAQRVLNADHFDLVISDMGTDSQEFTTFMRSIRSNAKLRTLPIIVLSGSLNVNLAYEAGANAFVAKTASLDKLFENVKALMHFWVGVATLPSLKPGRKLSAITA